MADTKRIDALIREFDAQKRAYMETFQRMNDLLVQNLAASSGTSNGGRPELRPRGPLQSIASSEQESDAKTSTTAGPDSIQASSVSKNTGDESDDEDADESLYVQTPLEPATFTQAGLRSHLLTHRFLENERVVLEDVLGNHERLRQDPLLPNGPGPFADRSHYTHSQIFDVGPDGSPLIVDNPIESENEAGRAMDLWRAIQRLNPDTKQRKAVGRITIVREPSPILFGAVHYVYNSTFYVEELVGHLVSADLSSAQVHRAFDQDERRRRTFVFNFEYFTLIGRDCEPMKWQMCAGQEDRRPGYIQISRCSSVMALALSGPPIRVVKKTSRQSRKAKESGYVYDPFAPWQVINLQCYPDLKASLNVHDSTKHYVNGVDAFMNTLLGEYRDAAKRYEDITMKISRRVRPSYKFMFDSSIREQLLFEDDEYNIVKRYFWAHQTLGIMNESIQALVDAYEDNFTQDVWEGKHKTLWPLLDENTARNSYYRDRMAKLKKAFEEQIDNLRKLIEENRDRQKEIISLREALFAGTSIKESRTTIQQGHNIKLLTLVSIFFLPLTFVTSVFGMSNMPDKSHAHWWMFSIVIATVCVPFFILIGSLNTNTGMRFWRARSQATQDTFESFFSWIARRFGKKQSDLVSVKSFDSQTTMSTDIPQRRPRRLGRRHTFSAVHDPEDPVSREAHQSRMDQPPATSRNRALSSEIANSVPLERTSTLASMWRDERKRKLRYSEEV